MSERQENRAFEFEEFKLDAAAKLLYRDGQQIVLTPKAVETLIALVENAGEVISKDDLMERIWPGTIVEESNLAQYLHVLRKTLGETRDGKPFVETLKRRGYRFNGVVRTAGIANESSAPESIGPVSTRRETFEATIPRNTDRGGVRASSQAAPQRETAHIVNVERSGNIYAVADWQREPAVEPPPPLVPEQANPKRFSPLLLIAAAAVLGVLAFGVYKFQTTSATSEIRSNPFRGSDVTRLTTSGKSKFAAISPDGRYVAHVMSGSDGDSLWVRQVAAANDTRVTAPLQGNLVWVTFAPDGNFLYYLSLDRDKGEPELFRVPVFGGPAVKTVDNIAPPSFSPDGTRMAFMRTNQEESLLIVANADGSNESVIASRREPDYFNMFWNAPTWSPDGKTIAFPVNLGDENGRYETVLAIDVDSHVERKLTDARWQQVGQPRWALDGLVVSASETSTGPQQLWEISLPDGAASRVTRDLNNYQNLSITADSKTLAVIQNHTVSNIWTAGGDSSAAKQILSEAGWLNELIWLPDGRLAYTSNAGGSSDIWTMNADGTSIRQLTVGANARLGLAVTADETQLIFAAERGGKYNLWRIGIDGSGLARVTSGDGEFYPQCTPDGRWIVYQSGGSYPTLWKMPLGGGEAVQITKTTASRPSLSPDGKYVAYHYLDSEFEKSRWGIGISSLEDGTRVKRFDFPPTVVERIVKWSRDGKSIAFLNSPGGIPNIWSQPLDGGETKALTNFPSDSIISFNWNADGTNLAVIRAAETSDVVLIDRGPSK